MLSAVADTCSSENLDTEISIEDLCSAGMGNIAPNDTTGILSSSFKR